MTELNARDRALAALKDEYPGIYWWEDPRWDDRPLGEVLAHASQRAALDDRYAELRAALDPERVEWAPAYRAAVSDSRMIADLLAERDRLAASQQAEVGPAARSEAGEEPGLDRELAEQQAEDDRIDDREGGI